ncbi:MAG TPA: macro domain-containing protein [Solirubrobacterales bacterium]|nr:macro domain-containing protein [Solirubrobacterales bacterium]
MRRKKEGTREKELQYELFHGYRTAIQVCPRGCGFHERARRDLLVRTRWSGRAKTTAKLSFETSHCPRDGAKLVRQCARCEAQVFAPIADRCQFCGVPQPWAAERRAGAERATLRLWRPDPDDVEENERQVHDPALRLFGADGLDEDGKAKASGGIWIIDGDISRLAVDAVISNDDVEGQMWSQSARSIKNAAGEGVERLAQEGKPFPLGHAWTTTAGDLRQMKSIVHVASMSRYGKSSIGTVRACLNSALALAAKQEFESVGLTPFGTGHAAIKQEEWFEVFAETSVTFLTDSARRQRAAPLAIVLVIFEPHNLHLQIGLLRNAIQSAYVRLGEPANGSPMADI